MSINFPNSPENGSTYTTNGITWEYSSANNSWTMITFGDPGVSNSTDFDNTIVTLDRVGARNLQVAANGLRYDPNVRTLSVTMASGQTANVIELKNNAGTTLNSFNARGILDKAGKIYYTSTPPTVNTEDVGQLWCNPSNNHALFVWSGSFWLGVNQSFGGVDLDSSQVITGTKTFNPTSGNGIELSGSTSCIAGSGASKTLIFKPTNASSLATEVLRLTSTAALFASGIELDFYVLGSHALGVVCSLTTTQSITALKTFTANIQLGGVDNKIFANDSTSGNVGVEDITLCSNLSPNSRYIKINGNFKDGGSDGITVNAKNSDGVGKLTLLGSALIQGDLNVSGSLSSTAGLYAQSIAYCSVSGGGVGSGNVSYPLGIGNKINLGPLEIYVGGASNKQIIVFNSKPTQQKFYYRVEQFTNSGSTIGVRLGTIAGNSTATLSLDGTSSPTGLLVPLFSGGNIPLNTTSETRPVMVTISLVN